MLSQQLIEKALALTGKTMEDMRADVYHEFNWYTNFSIEKFCYYLLSPWLQKVYNDNIEPTWFHTTMYLMFWESIYEYQSGNEEPLEILLSKI